MNRPFIAGIVVTFILSACVTTTADVRSLKQKRDVEGLVKIAQNSSEREQRIEAINALGFSRDPRAVKGLRAILDNDSWVEREAAVKSLSYLKDYQSINPIIYALNDSNQFVRASAEKGLILVAKSLGKKGEPRVLNKLIDAIRVERNGARKACIDAFHTAIDELRKIDEPTFLTYLIETSNDDSKYVRINVIKALGQFDDPRIINPLANAITDPILEVKEAAIQSLNKFRNPKNAKLLFEMLKHDNEEVRTEISNVLTQFDDPLVINKIIRSLTHDHHFVREGAARAMEKMVHPRAMMPLVSLLEDEHSNVRLAASNALEKYHWRPNGEKEAAVHCVASQQWENCAKYNKHVIKPLLVALNDEKSDIRHKASAVLTELKWQPKKDSEKGSFCVAKEAWDECAKLGKHAVPALVQELSGGSWQTKIAAADTLAKIGDTNAINPLIKTMQDSSPDVRVAIVEALAHFNDAQIVNPLVIALDDNNRSVRTTARDALETAIPKLKNNSDPAITNPILKAMKDNNRGVREVAARLLGEIKDPKSVSALVVALNDVDSDVRLAAKASLSKIKDTRAIGSLVAGLQVDNPEVRSQVVDALSQFKDHRAIEPLLKSINDNDTEVRIKSIHALSKLNDPRAIDPITKAARDVYAPVRIAAVQGLVNFNGDKVMDTLREKLKDYDSDVREEARKALLAKNWEPKTKQDLGYYCIARKDWLQCEEVGVDAIDPLLMELKQAESPYQDEAARVLGEINDPKTIKPLIEAISATQWQEDNYKKDTLLRTLKLALTKFGIQAVPELKATLTKWYTAYHTASVLDSLGWQPRRPEDEIHYLVARRANNDLQALWSETKKILMKDITSKDPDRISNALYAFIGLGREEIISELLNLLDNYGTIQIAEAYLNSGHKRLVQGAIGWSEDRGLEVHKYAEGNSPVQWGQL